MYDEEAQAILKREAANTAWEPLKLRPCKIWREYVNC